MQPDVDRLEQLARQSLMSTNGTLVNDGGDALGASTPMLADLLDEAAHLITTYTKLPMKEVAMLMACWIALTY